MDLVKSFFDKDEIIIGATTTDTKRFALNKIRSFWLYIVMWIIINLFFVYLYFLQDISHEYWFVAIPILGFDLIGVLAIYNSVMKQVNEIAEIGYVYTNKAIYVYNSGHNKMVNKILYTDVTGFEKAKEGTKGFYIYAHANCIKIEHLDNENFWYKEIVKQINNQKHTNK